MGGHDVQPSQPQGIKTAANIGGADPAQTPAQRPSQTGHDSGSGAHWPRWRSLRWSAGFGLAAAAPSAAAEPAQSYIVVLKDGVVDAGAAAAAQQSAYGFTASKVYRNAVNGYSATLTASQAQRLQADPNVDFVTAGRTFQQPRDLGTAATQETPFWRKRIAGTDSDVRKALDRGPARINVNVAVIDSGIDATHPDLNVKGGVDCQSGSPVDVTPVDVLGHGTFVAGVIGARNNRLGVIGTAPGTPLWSVRVVDDAGLISEESLICAIDWVTSTQQGR